MAEWILLLSQKMLKRLTIALTHARRRRHHSSIVLSMTLWSTAAAKHAENAAIAFYDRRSKCTTELFDKYLDSRQTILGEINYRLSSHYLFL